MKVCAVSSKYTECWKMILDPPENTDILQIAEVILYHFFNIPCMLH